MELPSELLTEHLLLLVDPKSLFALLSTHPIFTRLCDDWFWTKRIERDYTTFVIKEHRQRSLKETFKLLAEATLYRPIILDRTDILKYLFDDKEIDVDDYMYLAIMYKAQKATKWLLQRESYVKSEWLEDAAASDSPKILKLLLNHPHDDLHGSIKAAAEAGSIESLELLVPKYTKIHGRLSPDIWLQEFVNDEVYLVERFFKESIQWLDDNDFINPSSEAAVAIILDNVDRFMMSSLTVDDSLINFGVTFGSDEMAIELLRLGEEITPLRQLSPDRIELILSSGCRLNE